MRYFTDSLYERLMMKPVEIRPELPSLPPGHPCRGCSYYKGVVCIGYCCRKLLEAKKA